MTDFICSNDVNTEFSTHQLTILCISIHYPINFRGYKLLHTCSKYSLALFLPSADAATLLWLMLFDMLLPSKVLDSSGIVGFNLLSNLTFGWLSSDLWKESVKLCLFFSRMLPGCFQYWFFRESNLIRQSYFKLADLEVFDIPATSLSYLATNVVMMELHSYSMQTMTWSPRIAQQYFCLRHYQWDRLRITQKRHLWTHTNIIYLRFCGGFGMSCSKIDLRLSSASRAWCPPAWVSWTDRPLILRTLRVVNPCTIGRISRKSPINLLIARINCVLPRFQDRPNLPSYLPSTWRTSPPVLAPRQSFYKPQWMT